MSDASRTIYAGGRMSRRTMATLLILGAAVVGAILYLLFRAANEPTIIIRGNSIDFELADGEWITAGSRLWTHNKDESDTEEYIVRLTTEGSGTCPAVSNPVRRIEIDSFGPLRAMMQFRNKKTHVHHPAGALNSNGTRLESDDAEVVQQVRMWKDAQGAGPPWTCTFSESLKFTQLDVSDH